MRAVRWGIGLAALGWVAICGWGVAHREPDLSNPSAFLPWDLTEVEVCQIWISIEDLPPLVWQAFVAAEDPTLLERPRPASSPMARRLAAHVRRERGPGASRFEELVLGWRLDAELTRMELLDLYLDVVFLGGGTYGVEAAARHYFGKPANQLDLGEAALLAGMVPAPSRYSFLRDADLARFRRGEVLGRMVENGWLLPAEAATWEAAPIPTADPATRCLP
ncbi:MAG: transglycosylase domain-containing protein [Myxococcota bacterium]